MEPQFVHFPDVKAFELAAGVAGRPLFGEGAMLNLIEFEPGSVVPLHSHEHEQLGIVLQGMQALVVDGVPHEMGPMDGYVIPGGRRALRVLRPRRARSSSTSSGRSARTTGSAGTRSDRQASSAARSASSSGSGWPSASTCTTVWRPLMWASPSLAIVHA